MLLEIIIATLLVSLISFVGILVSSNAIKHFLHYFISFAAASLIAVAFFDLIPHSLKHLYEDGVGLDFSFIFVVIGVVSFFLIERFIHWHHCGKEDCHEKPTGLLILTGDFVHNFLDGILIAGAFLLDFYIGVTTTLAVIFHEIPQELGDFSVLIHSGYSKKKALLLNFFSALSAVLGGIAGFFAFDQFQQVIPYAVLIAAGGFLYISLSDIVPALHKHKNKKYVIFIESMIFVLTIVGFWFFLGFLH